ncbi:hypothetical protein D3C84_1152800 [compost metagenome]
MNCKASPLTVSRFIFLVLKVVTRGFEGQTEHSTLIKMFGPFCKMPSLHLIASHAALMLFGWQSATSP